MRRPGLSLALIVACSPTALSGCGPGPVSFGDSFYASRSPKRVAILPFDSPVDRAGADADGETMAALMTDALVAVRSYRVTERSKMKKILADQKTSPSTFVQERGLKETGELLGADLLVLGTVNRAEEQGGFWPTAELSLSVQCVDVKTGEIVWSACPDTKRSGSVRDASKSLCRQIAQKIQSEYETGSAPPRREALAARPRPQITTRPSTGVSSATTRPAAAAASQVWPKRHQVSEGETLSALSLRYYRSSRYVDHILKANRRTLDPDRLRIGETLLIPAPPEDATAQSAKGEDEP